jgi:cephalosporin hydroxylase
VRATPRARRARIHSAVTSRLPASIKKLIVDEFHRLYVDTNHLTTWATTRWMGVNCMKLPLDLWVIQEILFETKPDLLVETGIANGGSTLYVADVFERIGHGQVIAIDITLANADEQLFKHPRIEVIEGSSTDPAIVVKLRETAKGKRVMVDLDSDHRASHVEGELELLGPLVSEGCYLIVEDTHLGGHPVWADWQDQGPLEAVERWNPHHPEFVRDEHRERLMMTWNRKGYLKRCASP